ncbi:MAG: CehA/McbA family metallohydrolase [Sphaerochaeta sp.]|nr:CehA/McbA family metallohydrolase [Sphaerochaeta sp.]
MKELTIQRTFTKDETKQYLTLPFEVPEQTERIEVSYSYVRHTNRKTEFGMQSHESNIIDLGLVDETEQLRGWSGSDRTSVFISEHSATPGYRREAIGGGTWAVALGVYKVEESVAVTVQITIHPKEAAWLCGDLHMHTLNSDGWYTTAQVIEYAKGAKLDFIALTDHNNTEQNKEIGNPEGITVLPAMEYTNYRGHANFFFKGTGTSLAASPLSNTTEEMLTFFNEGRSAGSTICLNHISDDGCPWLFGFDEVPYDMVEIWNGFIKPSDHRARAWWHQRLCEGKKLAAVAGSDTHRIQIGRSYGCPCIWVYSLSRSRTDILTAIKEGRSTLASTPDSPRLDLHLGPWGLGDEGVFSEGLEGSISITRAKKGDILSLIDPDGVARTWTTSHNGDFSYTFAVGKQRFYRVELHRNTIGISLLEAMTNPVYLT